VCGVSLGDSDDALENALRKEFPEAEIRRDDKLLKSYIEVLLEHINGRKPHIDLPIDVQATAFQWQVWNHLLSIPYGRTRSYGEIAGALGQPLAARAVAQACARNRVALLIPCHRVVSSDGKSGGYRWGVARKRLLLEREKLFAHPKPERSLSASGSANPKSIRSAGGHG
jgi:AraC family transcriptional regulator of adaptative response/methylated-DNA-[protein]-cysteine methyltransferase